MTAPATTQTPAVVDVRHCPLRAFRVVLPEQAVITRRPTGFDWPCSCGKPGSQCSMDKDGNCE